MASEFTDISGNSPQKSHDKQQKKRSVLMGRTRLLLPLGKTSTHDAYEILASNNHSNGSNGNKSGLVTQKLKAITQKKELMEAVRKVCTPILLPRRNSTSTRISIEGNENSTTSETDSSQRDIENLEDGVHLNARKFNELKLMVDRKQRDVLGLLDELRVLQLENEALNEMQHQNTPMSKKINQIKQHIAQCTASMEEQMHVRRQLEHMIRRLQTAQLRIGAHLTGMAATVTSSKREVEEVKMLHRQLEVGKNRAVQLLQEAQLQIQTERKTRARELGDHEVRAKNSQKIESWRLRRAKERAEMIAEMRGDLSTEEEVRLLKSIEHVEQANEALHAANYIKSQKNVDFEAVLNDLKLTTGASCLREVVEKVTAQGTTSLCLEKEKIQAEKRLAIVRQEKEQVLLELNELKSFSNGGIERNCEAYSTLESEILQAKASLKVTKAANEQLDRVLSAVRQGSSSLAQRLESFDEVLENGLIGVVGSNAERGSAKSVLTSVSGSEHAQHLVMAESKLLKILAFLNSPSSFGNSRTDGSNDFKAVTSSDEKLQRNSSELAGNNVSEDVKIRWSPIGNNDPRLHVNNIRVRPTTRESPSTALRAAPSGFTSDDELTSTRSETGVDNDDVQLNGLVPSRNILKTSSSRHFAKATRQKELAEKHKAAVERGTWDEELLAKMRRRKQLEADTRLAVSPTRYGLDFSSSKPLQ